MKQAKSSSKHSTHLTVYQLHPLRQAVRDAVGSQHPRRQWACGLVAATLIGVAFPTFGQTLEVSDLDGTNGFKINGETARDNLGWSVSGAGDVNGDGIDDVIIGAFYADSHGRYSGTSYVVFGDDQGFSTPLMQSSLC